MTGRRSWQPVLDEAERARAAGILDEMAVMLAGEVPPAVGDAAALTDGLPGRALFFAGLNRARPRRGHQRTARRLLDAAVEQSEAVAGSPSLFSGITGLAWVIQHLGSLARPRHIAALEAIDAAMLQGLMAEPAATEFDLMSGLVGHGVLALERAPAPAALAVLARIVPWLDASAEPAAVGVSWRTPPSSLHAAARDEFPNGCHYPGVAHGSAGVIGLLAGVLALGVEPAVTRRLLGGAVEWVLAHELPGGMALFPFQVDGDPQRPASRSAWCTGGPGISLMLWRAGRASGEAEWQSRAVEIAKAAASRPLTETGVKDASLCHGSSGLGQLYARWFNETGNEFFRDEARRWFRSTLEGHEVGQGVAGYSAANEPKGRREAAPGLLFGAAGVGLALLAASTDIEPSWDRVFLMSGR